MKEFIRRDVGCNRTAILDENGNFLRVELRPNIFFEDTSDLVVQLQKDIGTDWVKEEDFEWVEHNDRIYFKPKTFSPIGWVMK